MPRAKPNPERLGLRAYADHRKERGFPGASLQAVQIALKYGRIARTCEKHPRCPAPGCSDGWLEPSRCDLDWLANTDAGKRRPGPKVEAPEQDPEQGMAGAVPSMNESQTLTAHWKQLRERMELEQAAGKLVDADRARNAAFNVFRQLQSALLAIPARLSGELADMTDRHEIRERLEDEMRKAIDGAKELSFK